MLPHHKIIGLVGSWCVVGLGMLDVVDAHIKIIAGIIATVASFFFAWNLLLENTKKRREERMAHRMELREIDDALCRKRQRMGDCPYSKYFTLGDEEIEERQKLERNFHENRSE